MKNEVSPELVFFSLLARHGSLSAAARALDITPPAATKRLAQMEQRLGVRLVNRTTRRVSLTSEGETYLQHATRILADIQAMEDQLAGSRVEPRGLLRVNATLGFGRTVIAPLVSDYARQHPDVQVQLEVTDRPVDLVQQGYDVAIRFGQPADSRLSARRLLSNRRFLCASPAYLNRHGAPQTPAALQEHRCIIHRQNDEAYGAWRFTRDRQTEVVKVSGALASNDGDIVLGWALDGHGILVRSEWDLAKYLETGRLRRLLPAYTLEPADLFVYYSSRQHMSARVRSFIDFMAASFDQAARRPSRAEEPQKQQKRQQQQKQPQA
ncbi:MULTISPECIES: LysR family transcriptional regulator [unclassified Achromobacter]|uniref:LysR family transcriptional regulator n=1 Tax=unclassified Achromobacter TaxID=2626865 RepID=UPI000B51BC30|nr:MULTISPECIES: LysR family transcriptional regulator [unclassified Achromobacter]OWT73411.1 LysR family transcriptional regulator [Achromobacter sp. HZ34]OWT79672.1 LysR family transcriptional regulator [Achromobacter sp. HZ28]